MGEVDDQLAAAPADIGPVDPAELSVPDAAQARPEPVDLTARAEPRYGREEREGRHEQAERPAQRFVPGRDGNRRRG